MPRSRRSGRLQRKSLTRIISTIADAIIGRPPEQVNGLGTGSRYGVEPLEQRLMFVVLGGPGTNGVFEFLDAGQTPTRVAWNDMTFELIGVAVGTPANTSGYPIDGPSETVFTPPIPTPPPVPAPVLPTNLANIYTIYILQSNAADSWISIAHTHVVAGAEVMNPFDAGPTLSVLNAGTGVSPITFNSGAVGGVLIGALQNGSGTVKDTNQPILSVPFNDSVDPGPYNPGPVLTPGIFMSPIALEQNPDDPIDPTDFVPITQTVNGVTYDTPNDIGRFFLGGVITGTVDIPSPAEDGFSVPPPSAANSADPALNSQGGNVGVFYAGAILTGDAGGIDQVIDESASSQTPNFTVAGDIRDLVTSGDIGGDLIEAARPDMAHYFTGFDLQVGGTVGEMYLRTGNFFGTFDIEHDPSVYGLPDNLFTESELEWVVELGNDGNIFQGGIVGNTGTGLINPPELPSPPFSNNATPDGTIESAAGLGTPQYLGSIRETDSKTGLPLKNADGAYVYVAEVSGNIQGEIPAEEVIDNYAVSLMAGQTIIITADSADEALCELVDPTGRIVATDDNKVNPNLTFDAPFSYTPTEAGVYTITMIDPVPTVTDLFDIPYTITVQGVGDMSLGALVAQAGDIYDGGFDSAFTVSQIPGTPTLADPTPAPIDEVGDLGAIIAGGIFGSGTEGGSAFITDEDAGIPPPSPISIEVPDGNLRTVDAASIGFDVGEDAAIAPFLDVPRGSVGLLQAFDPAGILAIQTRFNLFSVDIVNPQLPDNSVTSSPTPTAAVGGDFQMINGYGTVEVAIACDKGIGDILAGNMVTLDPSFIEVNADNTGDDGIIDLIDVTGDMGVPGDGGPGIVTNDGGDVRYIECGGLIYRDAFFGSADEPDTVVHAPGQVVTFTDDDGATLTLTPVGDVAANPAFTAATAPVSPTIQPTVGPELLITSYPIRGSGGSVLVDVAVTDIDATDPLTGNASECGLAVSGTSTASGAVAEISRIQIEGNNPNAYTPTGPVDANGLPTVVNAVDVTSTTNTTGVVGVLPALSLTITGSTEVDVLNVVVTQLVNPQLVVLPDSTESGEAGDSLTPTLGNAALISDDTPNAEIARVLANSIGTIFSAGTIGVAKHSTPEAVLPIENVSYGTALVVDGAADGGGRFSTSAGTDYGGTPNLTDSNDSGDQSGVNASFPFELQKTGVSVDQSIENVEANEGLGNILAVGSIGNVQPNFDGKPHAGYFAGIIGPIVAVPLEGGTISVDADLNNVSIGQGIISSGTGIFSLAGLYAVQIGTVSGNNADIRGQIESLLSTANINLHNGSLIGAEIITVNLRAELTTVGTNQAGDTFDIGFTQAVVFFPGVDAINGGLPVLAIENPLLELGTISVGGNGGIIGTYITADNIGTIISAGFGILESTITTQGTDEIANIIGGGWGIRGVTIDAGADIGTIDAAGNGSNLSVALISPDVRLSESQPVDPITGEQFDPNTGMLISALSDVDAYLGTSQAAPVINGTTDTGVIEDCVITASTTLTSLTAQTVRVSEPVFQLVTLPDTQEPNIPMPGKAFPMQINVGNNIGTVKVRGVIDGLSITTGRIGRFLPFGSVSRLGITVAGVINQFVIHGNFGQVIADPATNNPIPDSYLQAIGPNGTIQSMTVTGNLNADVTAVNSIGRLIVGGNIVGTITTQGRSSGLTLGYLRVGGAIADGSLIVDGNAGTIITNGGLGSATGSLTIEGNLNSLSVGASHGRGASLELPLHVEGTLGSLTVYGRIDGTVQIDGDLKKLKVTNDGTQSNIINGNMTVNGRLYTADIINGNIAANIIANGFIKSFTVSRGSVQSDGSVQSQIDTIQNFRITGGAAYGMFGSLLAVSGLNENIDISGNVGDGVDPADITATTGNRFRVRGSIRTNATIAVSGQLKVLQVDHNIETNANVSAHPLEKLIVGGTNTGNVITV